MSCGKNQKKWRSLSTPLSMLRYFHRIRNSMCWFEKCGESRVAFKHSFFFFYLILVQRTRSRRENSSDCCGAYTYTGCEGSAFFVTFLCGFARNGNLNERTGWPPEAVRPRAKEAAGAADGEVSRDPVSQAQSDQVSWFVFNRLLRLYSPARPSPSFTIFQIFPLIVAGCLAAFWLFVVFFLPVMDCLPHDSINRREVWLN